MQKCGVCSTYNCVYFLFPLRKSLYSVSYTIISNRIIKKCAWKHWQSNGNLEAFCGYGFCQSFVKRKYSPVFFLSFSFLPRWPFHNVFLVSFATLLYFFVCILLSIYIRTVFICADSSFHHKPNIHNYCTYNFTYKWNNSNINRFILLQI